MLSKKALAFVVIVLLAVGGGPAVLAVEASQAADTKPSDVKPADAKAADADKSADKAVDKADEEPVLSVTAHSVTVDGKVIKYHATAGYMVVKVEEGKPLPVTTQGRRGLDADSTSGDGGKDDSPKFKDGVKAVSKIFFVAYTLDDAGDPATRPITFLFNGGPGSSSMWLHMGSVAPRRAVLTEEGESLPPPYRMMDNEDTWLDKTDLVFIDPVSTGFSRPMPKEDVKQFHGLKEDIASVGEFIRLYTTRNTRWASPKLMLGESYGTTRAAGLTEYLQSRYGLYLNGVILVSSGLNFEALNFTPQNDLPYITFLPSYATAAWYHKKLSPEMQAKSLEEIASEARSFATGEYTQVLVHGDAASEKEKAHAAVELSRFTGIPANEFLLRRLRLTDFQFFTRLLLADGKYLGRLDARFTGLTYNPGDTDPSGYYDPAEEALEPAFSSGFNDYIRRELKFESDLPYEDLTDVSPWNYGDPYNGFPNTADDLRRAMTRNPYLKVWVTCSYYDLATPFFAAENVIASMNLDPAIRSNVRFTYYASGHMLYIRNSVRAKFRSDFLSFLNDATSQPVIHASAP
jgi:carboxypeptidase C (cathepsin A)